MDKNLEYIINKIVFCLEDEMDGSSTILSKTPSSLVAQSLSLLAKYPQKESDKIKRAIGFRGAGWFSSKANNLYQKSEDAIIYNSFTQHLVYGNPYYNPIKAFSRKNIKECINRTLNELLNANPEKNEEPNSYSYNGKLRDTEVYIEVIFKAIGTIEYSVSTHALKKVIDLAQIRAPSYENILGCGIGAWNLISDVGMDGLRSSLIKNIMAVCTLSTDVFSV